MKMEQQNCPACTGLQTGYNKNRYLQLYGECMRCDIGKLQSGKITGETLERRTVTATHD